MPFMLILLVLLILVGSAASWFIDNPGFVTLTWLGYRIDTTVTVLAVSIVATFVAGQLLWILIKSVAMAPFRFRKKWQEKNLERGLDHLVEALLCIMGDNQKRLEKLSISAAKYLHRPSLRWLLPALGKGADLGSLLPHLQVYPETRSFAIRQMLDEAETKADFETANDLAVRAHEAAPHQGWAAMAALRRLIRLEAWRDAQILLFKMRRERLWQGGVLDTWLVDVLCMRALACLKENDKAAALEHYSRAHKIAPTNLVVLMGLVPLLEEKRAGSGLSLLEKNWRQAPKRVLSQRIIEQLPSGDTNLKKAKRLKSLAHQQPNAGERLFLMAEAAVLMDNPTEAIRHLEALVLVAPDKQALQKLAGLLRVQQPDSTRAIAALEQAATAPLLGFYRCGQCYTEHAAWHIICAHCGTQGMIEFIS
jgi:HemY protein